MDRPSSETTMANIQPGDNGRFRSGTPLVKIGPRFSLQVSLLAVTIATVLLTALAVHLPWSYTADTNLVDMSRQLNEEIITGVRRQVRDMFDSAIADQRSIAGLIENNVVDMANEARRDAFFLSFLKTNPYYSFVALGMPGGDFYGAYRRDDHNLAAITSAWNKGARRALRSERQFVGDGRTFAPVGSTEKTNDYFAPSRQWYQLAVATPQQDIITDAYIFANSLKPGINTATAVAKSGGLYGVVTIAIELERISLYLRSLSIGKTGTAFIVDAAGKVVASREPTAVAAPDQAGGQEPLLGGLEDMPAPLLRIARQALQQNGVKLADVQATREFVVATEGENYFVTLAPAEHRGWVIGTVIPEADFTANIRENHKKLLLALLLTVLVTGALAVRIARQLFIKPIAGIIEQARHIERFELAQVRYSESRIIEVDELSAAVKQMSLGLASFGKYLPTSLVQTLFANGIEAELSAEKRTMTILFMDLAGFTTISEAMGPRMLPPLSRYFSVMSDVVEDNRGTIDKYIGDAVMAFWGAPSHLEEHGPLACRAALQCLRSIERLREEWPEEWRDRLRVRIGVNSGRVMVGNIGSASRLNYTVVGDPVNLASRLEGTCKNYGVDCIIGQNTYELAKYDIVARRLDTTTVKGRVEPVAIYELLAMADEAHPPGHFDWVAVYEGALNRFEARDWARAKEEFRRVVEMRGGDAPAELFIRRCDECLLPGAPC